MKKHAGRQSFIIAVSGLLVIAGSAQAAPFAFSASLFPGFHAGENGGTPTSVEVGNAGTETKAARVDAPSDDALEVPELAELEMTGD